MTAPWLVPEDLVDIKEQARDSIAKGCHSAAFSLIEGAHHCLPKDVELHLLLVESALELNRLHDIPVQWLRGVGQGNPDLCKSLLQMSRSLRQGDKVNHAAELSAMLTEIDPWHAPSWFERALCSRDLGDEQWAVYFTRRALAVDADYAPAQDFLKQVEQLSMIAKPLSSFLETVRESLVAGKREEASRMINTALRTFKAEQWVDQILEMLGEADSKASPKADVVPGTQLVGAGPG